MVGAVTSAAVDAKHARPKPPKIIARTIKRKSVMPKGRITAKTLGR
jgi:hypothetical protein